MFFCTADHIVYDNKLICDITKRINFMKPFIENPAFYFKYQVVQGELPEDVAYNFYGRADYHWIVIFMNEIYDPFYDWFMDYNEVLNLSKQIYGDPDYLNVKYWIDSDGIKYSTDTGGLTAVSHLDYEIEKNDARQEIKLPHVEYIEQIVREYHNLVRPETVMS